MHMKRLSQDSSDSIKGIVFQFYHAISHCFDLLEDQSLYIEKYGDVSIEGKDNIEIKAYEENLTDNHENFWKTLLNWLLDDFPNWNYTRLLLITTQNIGPNSRLLEWNKKTAANKLDVLRAIHSTAQRKYKESGKKEKPSSLKLMDQVFLTGDDKLLEVLAKFHIYDSSPTLKDEYKVILQKHGKGILEKNKEQFIAALLGFILKPRTIETNGWEITYETFTKEVEKLTEQYCTNTKIFPRQHLDDLVIKTDVPRKEEYIKKIIDIEYEEVLSDAHINYMGALNTILEEFNEGTSKKRLQNYCSDLLEKFQIKYRMACRNCSENVIKESKDFFDECMYEDSPSFSGYDIPPSKFKNGVLHMEMDDLDKDLKWKIKKEIRK